MKTKLSSSNPMTAKLVDGKKLAERLHENLSNEITSFRQETGKPIGLATILVGEDPASKVYVQHKRLASSRAGITDHHRQLPAEATQEEVEKVIKELAQREDISGILLQLPLPPHLKASPLIDLIPWNKDVDGLTTASAGRLARGEKGLRPCTPSGILTLLDEYQVPLEGANVVVIGWSELVGRPLAQMLLQRHATVTTTHIRTRNLADITHRADIVIAAAGVPELVSGGHIRKDSVVIDVGIHRTSNGLIGDVDFDTVAYKTQLISPVPGGVGPMTIFELLRNTLKAARLQV